MGDLATERSGANIVWARRQAEKARSQARQQQKEEEKRKLKAKKVSLSGGMTTQTVTQAEQVYTSKGENVPGYVGSAEKVIQIDATTRLIKASRPTAEQEKERYIQKNLLIRRKGESTGLQPSAEYDIASGGISFKRRKGEKIVEQPAYIQKGGVVTKKASRVQKEERMIELEQKTGLSRRELEDMNRIQVKRVNKGGNLIGSGQQGIIEVKGKAGIASPKAVQKVTAEQNFVSMAKIPYKSAIIGKYFPAQRQIGGAFFAPPQEQPEPYYAEVGNAPTVRKFLRAEGGTETLEPFEAGYIVSEASVKTKEEREAEYKRLQGEFEQSSIFKKALIYGIAGKNIAQKKIGEGGMYLAYKAEAGISSVKRFASTAPFKSVEFGKSGELNPLAKFKTWEGLEKDVAGTITGEKYGIKGNKYFNEAVGSLVQIPRAIPTTITKLGETAIYGSLLSLSPEGQKEIGGELYRAGMATPESAMTMFNPLTGSGAVNLGLVVFGGTKITTAYRNRPRVALPKDLQFKAVAPTKITRVTRNFPDIKPIVRQTIKDQYAIKGWGIPGGKLRALEQAKTPPKFFIEYGRSGKVSAVRYTEIATGKTTIIAKMGGKTTYYKLSNAVNGYITGTYKNIIQKGTNIKTMKGVSFRSKAPTLLSRNVDYNVDITKDLPKALRKRMAFQGKVAGTKIKVTDIYKTGLLGRSKVTTYYDLGRSMQTSTTASKTIFTRGLQQVDFLKTGQIKKYTLSKTERIRPVIQFGEKAKIAKGYVSQLEVAQFFTNEGVSRIYYFEGLRPSTFTADAPSVMDIRQGTPLSYLRKTSKGWQTRPVAESRISGTVQRIPISKTIGESLRIKQFLKSERGQLSLSPQLIYKSRVVTVPTSLGELGASSFSPFSISPYPSISRAGMYSGIASVLGTRAIQSNAQAQRFNTATSTKNIQMPSNKVLYRGVSGTSLKPISIVRPLIKVNTEQIITPEVIEIQDIDIGQQQKQQQRQRQITNLKNKDVIPVIIQPPITPPPPPPPPPPDFGIGIPFFGFGDLSGIGRGWGTRKGAKRKYEYKPSIRAFTLGIFGKAKKGRLTGFEERPLPLSFKKFFRGG